MAGHALSRARARGNPTSLPGYQGKRLTPLLAIQAFCRSCMGGNALLTLLPRPVSPATESASTSDQMEVRHV